MAVNIEKNGEFQVIYAGPYTGFNTMMPENLIPDSASPATNDFMFRNAELRSRPAFQATISAPAGLTAKVVGIGNLNGGLWAVSLGNGLYSYNYGSSTWTLIGGSAPVASNNITTRVFNGTLYIAGGSHLASWDGTTFTLDIANLAVGPTTIGAIFLDELDNHLLMGNTAEHIPAGTTLFGGRIRWSATGLPTQWDPTVNTNAGFNDFLDVPDGITGMLMLGRTGYILRTDGITEVAPTGRGAAPFEFNHLWASQNGIGNIKFFASAQYGTTAIIAARDNIYSIMSYQVSPIGGGARDQILTDMGFASAAVGGSAGIPNTFACIVPYFLSGVVPDSINTSGQGGGTVFPYLVYMLFLNIGNNCKVWVYDFDQQNWTNFTLVNVNVTGRPALCVNAAGQQILYVPYITPSDGHSLIGFFNIGLFNDGNQGSSHSYKVEDIVANFVPTIRRVVITYRDLGTVTFTVTITGTDDLGATVTQSAQVTVGPSGGTNTLRTVFVDITITCYRPQLTISKAASAGPLSISTVTMIGRVDATTSL